MSGRGERILESSINIEKFLESSLISTNQAPFSCSFIPLQPLYHPSCPGHRCCSLFSATDCRLFHRPPEPPPAPPELTGAPAVHHTNDSLLCCCSASVILHQPGDRPAASHPSLALLATFLKAYFTEIERKRTRIMSDEISLDLEELRHLQTIAKRPRVVSLISSEICNLEKLSKENASTVPQPPPVPLATQVVSTTALSYSTLSSFSWDQDSDKVKIYLSLEGVQEEKVEKTFNPMSFELKFYDVQGKNYKFGVPKLQKEIVPEKCKLIVKPTRVTVVLAKASKGNWLDLHYKEDKLKPKLDESKDPMAGIMDLMKNMYEEGDEEMKRTIAKAWSEARSGKASDPLKGYR